MDDDRLIVKKDKEEGYCVKFVVVGDSKVGKTNLVNLYARHQNIKGYSQTIGRDVYQDINFKIGEDIFVLKIIDTASDKKFLDEIKSESENANFVLVVFDVTNKDSFLSLNHWINHCRSSGNERINFIIVGNKNDLITKRKVTEEEANSFAKNNGMKYYDISAFNKEEVKKIFNEAFDSFHQEFLENNDPNAYRKTDVTSEYIIERNRRKKNNCC